MSGRVGERHGGGELKKVMMLVGLPRMVPLLRFFRLFGIQTRVIGVGHSVQQI